MKKISFIVIGKNEEKTIFKCINSILDTINYSKLKKYEIIYVDSSSSDNTTKIIKDNFKDKVKIVILKNKMNAAIARNIGVKHASGDTYFFIDADMIINKEFLNNVYNEESGLLFDFVSGKLREILFEDKDNKIDSINEITDRYNVRKEAQSIDWGGVFLIKRDLFNSVIGFKNYLRKTQDIDLGLRLAKKRVYFTRIPVYIATHFTVHYVNRNRIFKSFLKGDFTYRGVVYRENLINKYTIRKIFESEKLTFIFIISIILSFYSLVYLMIYPVFIFIKHINRPLNNYFENFVGDILRCISVIIGFFVFYPKDIKASEILYQNVNT